jgi:DNA-directed RNA polymerase III subunit RPC7
VHWLKGVLELERYSDKYRPSAATQPTLKRKDLHAPFFPTEVFEDYFNPKRKKKPAPQQPTTGKVKMNLEELAEDAEDEVSQNPFSYLILLTL